MILHRTKFALVGIELLHALHTRFLTLLNTSRLQIFFHNGFMELVIDRPACCKRLASYKNL